MGAERGTMRQSFSLKGRVVPHHGLGLTSFVEVAHFLGSMQDLLAALEFGPLSPHVRCNLFRGPCITGRRWVGRVSR